MRCSSCEHENRADSRFCEHCGAGSDRSCSACGATLSADARFCRHCGTQLPGASGAADMAGQEPDAAAAHRSRDGAGSGERRQLTVMFCDLVGSTALGQRLDPEELRELLTAYQDACASAVKRYDGHVAQYLGDGVLVYFGFPRAHEDDAERAVHAALAIQSSLAELNERRASRSAVAIEARIGIHTGLAVVSEIGDDSHHQPLAPGDTSNVAARLEGVADPGGIVISQSTLRLVAGLFVTRDLGTPELRGVSEPVAVHAVERRAGVSGPLGESATLTRLAGRNREVAQFQDCWDRTRKGHGQVLAVSGDAGIGKSRLVRALRDNLADAPHTWLEVRASPYTSGSAFQPVIELYSQGLGFADLDTPAQRLVKLEAGLEAVPELRLDESVPYLAALLGLPPSERFPLPSMSPEAQRERTIAALMAPIVSMETLQPVVLVCEDLHWSDPSTLELLGRLIDQVPTLRLLVILTSRPAFEPPWPLARSYVSPVALARLEGSHAREVVEAVAGERGLPERVIEQIVSRADGVPLFAEELARSVVDSGMLVEVDGRYEFRGRISDLTIPTTLQGSLMARLDRLSAAKAVAQLAATLGREFGYDLIEAVADVEVPVLRGGLAQLVDAEILFQRGTPPESTYTFKHALLQDTAYESQLKRRRKDLHARTAAILQERFAHRIEAEPAVMARLCAEGGLTALAVTYYQRAGDQAIGRLSNSEAIEYYGRALELLAPLPESAERDQRDIELRLKLAGPLAASRGFEDPEAIRSCEQLEALCEKIGRGPQQLPALVGLLVYHQSRGDLPRARRHADSLLRVVEPLGIPMLRIAGHVALGASSVTCTTIPEALDHLDQAIELAKKSELTLPTAPHDVDILTVALSVDALALVLAGRPESAIPVMQASIDRARELGHPHTMAIGLCGAAITGYFLDDPDWTERWADETLAAVRGLGFHNQESSALLFRGWARVCRGDTVGLDEVEEGIDRAVATGSLGGIVQLNIAAADAFQRSKRFERAAEFVERAGHTIERTGERTAFVPQLPLFRAGLLLESGEGSLDEAERLLLESIEGDEGWRAYRSPWMELRPAIMLARCAQRTGHVAEARARLSQLYARFGEGFERPRLREARELLGELGFSEGSG